MRAPARLDFVCRVDAQPVEANVRKPVARAVQHQLAKCSLVESRRFAPSVFAITLEVRIGERWQVIAVRTEMIVNDVEDDAEPAAVCRIHERHDVFEASVGSEGRHERNAVVAPTPLPSERSDRHDLHDRDAELGQLRQLLCCGLERPLLRERANVEFVEDLPAFQVDGTLLLRRPRYGRDTCRAMYALRESACERVDARHAVDHDLVVGAHLHTGCESRVNVQGLATREAKLPRIASAVTVPPDHDLGRFVGPDREVGSVRGWPGA